jgi:hypothetical protein
MKYKYIISIAILGILIHLFAFWSKITHQAFTGELIFISFSLIIVSGLLLIIKILTSKNKDSFLNK